MKTLKIAGLAVMASVLGIALGQTAAFGQSVEEFYEGKRIKIVSSSEPGGGYDTYARTVARHIGRHIPGNPKLLVQNMPGAGGVVAANWLYNVGAQDGTIIGSVQRAVPFVPIFGKKGPKYDPAKFHWLGSLNNEVGVLSVWRKTSPVKTIQEAMQTEVLLGGTGPNDTEIYPALMNNTIGTKFRIITGYPSTTTATLAIERGEIQGLSQSFSSMKARAPRNWRDDVRVLVQLSTRQHPELPDVPLIFDLLKDKGEEVNTIWRLMLTQKVMGRPYMLGPNVPADRVAALRKAFEDMVKDPKFLADAAKQRREVVFVSGPDIQKMITKVASAPASIIAKMDVYTTYRGKKGKVKVSLVKHTGKVTKTKRGGRRIFIDYKGKEIKAKVSGSRTKVTIDGKKTKRKHIKAGMTCTFTYPGAGQEAKNVDCKS